jgi:nucleoside-diphosphate-sugar epimerase
MKLLVTGGTGFIGSHLALEGRRRGAEVAVLGLTERPEERANMELLSAAGVEVVSGSITDPDRCAFAARGATHIFHLAVAMREGGKRDEFFERVNLEGTRRLLEAAAKGAVERFVYCSTIGIYGHRAPGVTREESPLAPGNIYERTKVAAEALVREFGAARKLPIVILRPADVYGPRDRRLLKLFKGVSRGRFPLFGPGSGRRHMIYVDDVVSAFFQACERSEAIGETMIVAGPEVCTLNDLIDLVRRTAGTPRFGWKLPLAPMLAVAGIVEDVCRVLHLDPPIYRRRMDFFWSDSEFDIAHARRLLGWAPRVALADGVRRTFEDYRGTGLLGGTD